MTEEKITVDAGQMDFLCGFFGQDAVLEHFDASTKGANCVVPKGLFLASWEKLVEKFLQKDEPVKFDQHLKMCRFLDRLPNGVRFEARQLWLTQSTNWELRDDLLTDNLLKNIKSGKEAKEIAKGEADAEARLESKEGAKEEAVKVRGRKSSFTTGEKIMLGSAVLGVVGCLTLACTVPRENSERAFEICGEVVGAMFLVGLIWHLASNFNSAGPSSAPVSPNEGPGVLRSR